MQAQLKNPHARPGRPLYNYDAYVDQSAKRLIALNRNLLSRSGLNASAKSIIQDAIDDFETSLRHGNDGKAVVSRALVLSATIKAFAKPLAIAGGAYNDGLAKSAEALGRCFRTVGNIYNFHETLGPQQDQYFASLRDDFVSMGLTGLTRVSPGRVADVGAAIAEACAAGVRTGAWSKAFPAAHRLGVQSASHRVLKPRVPHRPNPRLFVDTPAR